MVSSNWDFYFPFVIGFMVIFAAPNCYGLTDQRDVVAISSLYVALGSPALSGWHIGEIDPCGEAWEGVECVFSNITAIKLNGENLGGELGNGLDSFTSIITIDLSANHIGGTIPSNLPLTVRTLSLSGNEFTGNIPDTLSTLSQLTEMSLSDNHLTGIIPDVFQELSGLISLNFSGNNLSGQLPPSMGDLGFLRSLNLRNNQLSGTLDVLVNLPLVYLNIENNLFSGPIPWELLSIPNFRRSGNPFNTTISPESSFPPYSPSMPPYSDDESGTHAFGPSSFIMPHGSKKSTKKITAFAVVGILIILAIAVGLYLFISKRSRKTHMDDKIPKNPKEKFKNDESLLQRNNLIPKLPREEVKRPREVYLRDNGRMDMSLKQAPVEPERVIEVVNHNQDHRIDMSGRSEASFKHMVAQPLAPSLDINSKKLVELSKRRHSSRSKDYTNSLRSFTIATLQQCTNSFSQDNLIGQGIIGSVYRAELPDGKLLAIKKLDSASCTLQDEADFFAFLSSTSKLLHPNVAELVGYCAEHGQSLLAYEYCGNMTLYDALHLDDEMHKKLSWNVRIRIALGAAKALEYLHEGCQPANMHQNFKTANIILDDKLSVRVSDCGLAPIMTPGTVSKLRVSLSAYGYGAPEVELGSYSYRSDIYSFGVVMLELLTGRKSFDKSRPRGEQFLGRWAMTQLHDIDSLSRMVDPSLNGSYPSKALSRLADIISRCIQSEPEFRPSMSEIVQDLSYMVLRIP